MDSKCYKNPWVKFIYTIEAHKSRLTTTHIYFCSFAFSTARFCENNHQPETGLTVSLCPDLAFSLSPLEHICAPIKPTIIMQS